MSLSHRLNPDAPYLGGAKVRRGRCGHVMSEIAWKSGSRKCWLCEQKDAEAREAERRKRLQEHAEEQALNLKAKHKGEAVPYPPKLTIAQRIEICDRIRDGECDLSALAREYGVAETTIRWTRDHETKYRSEADSLNGKAAETEPDTHPPRDGYCMEHAMPVIEGETCPGCDDGSFCIPDCIDWRDRRPVTDEQAAALERAIDEKFAPVPEPVTVHVAWPVPGDAAMEALMRLAESVPMTQDHRDLITIAHELGLARGGHRVA